MYKIIEDARCMYRNNGHIYSSSDDVEERVE